MLQSPPPFPLSPTSITNVIHPGVFFPFFLFILFPLCHYNHQSHSHMYPSTFYSFVCICVCVHTHLFCVYLYRSKIIVYTCNNKYPCIGSLIVVFYFNIGSLKLLSVYFTYLMYISKSFPQISNTMHVYLQYKNACFPTFL